MFAGFCRQLVSVVWGVLAIFGGVWPALGQAQSNDMYVCIDDSGVRTYQNTGGGKGCKKLNLEPLTSVPAPRLPAASMGSSSSGKSSGSTIASRDPSAADREFDRKRILEDELRKEEARLGELRSEYNEGQPDRRGDEKNYQKYLDRTARLKEDLARSEANVNALKRELSKL